MKDSLPQLPLFCRRQSAKKILLETLLVAVTGIAFALLANRLSPRSLGLANNYFPASPPSSHAAATGMKSPGNNPQTNAAPIIPAEPSVAVRLKENGLQLVEGAQAEKLFHDPSYQQLIVFIDARDDQNYQEGHIPGAWQFDHYHPEKYLAAALSVCEPAEQVVVYCHGGDCDDSEFAAIALRDAGIANQKLFVYAGGITEWTTNHLPVEVGARNSGQLKPSESTK